MRRLALDERKNFLDEDLSDALKGLFVGAVVWVAADTLERCPFQKGLGMFTSLVQARALYEFYSPKPAEDDDARASHFAPNWRRTGVTSLYTTYMGRGMPANKRVFHLVYGRSAHAGGPMSVREKKKRNYSKRIAHGLRKSTDTSQRH